MTLLSLNLVRFRAAFVRWLRVIFLAGVVVAAAGSAPQWWPLLREQVDAMLARYRPSSEGGGETHPVASASRPAARASLELTPQARESLGLTGDGIGPIGLSTYWRTMVVPAVVVARPGRSHLQVAAPLTGVVTHVHAVTGETVTPGTLLFQIRLTHEDLVRGQREFLQTLGELDVERREYERLRKLSEPAGVIAGRLLLERQYAVEKLESSEQAQREALRLHGLSDAQVESIVSTRRLLRELQVRAPSPDDHDHPEEEWQLLSGDRGAVALHDVESDVPLIVERLAAHKGQAVQAGELLCTLADYRRLFIEGQAFEQDAAAVVRAMERGWTIEAVFDAAAGGERLSGLQLAFVGHGIDPQSRTLPFYVELDNAIVRDQTNAAGQRFLTWRYRPGQRLELRVPVEEWTDQFVLPAEAVAIEGTDAFVFLQNGRRFDRVSVRVLHRDRQNVVIARDGSLFPGDVVARRGAHQMQMAIQNQSSGGGGHGHSHDH